MKRAYFSVSHDLLKNLLRLPDNWEILGIFPPTAQNYGNAWCEFVVQGEGLPETKPGKILMHVAPTFETIDGEAKMVSVSGEEGYYYEFDR